MSSGVSNSSLLIKYIQIFLLTVFCSSFEVDVVWEAKFPAVFGNVTYLQCNISDEASNCSKKTRQWFGGPSHLPLCENNNCAISDKYKVMKQPNCLYTLMIRNFSELDVNCDYTCSYGVSQKRRNLTLDEHRFIYEPRDEDIHEQTKENGNTLNWKINISKIFPTPLCGADLDGESITDSLQISVTKPGFYFTAALQTNLSLSSCGTFNVYCYLGEYKINITTNNFGSCHLQGGENIKSNGCTIMLALIIPFTILIVVSVFMVCIYRKDKLCFNKSGRGDLQPELEISLKKSCEVQLVTRNNNIL